MTLTLANHRVMKSNGNMKNFTCLLVLALFTFSAANAQKKKELIAQIEQLKQEKTALQGELSTAKRNATVNKAEADALQEQLDGLKETNESLMSSMTSFTTLSEKKSENLERSLALVKEKDKQLDSINAAIRANNAQRVAILTTFKNELAGDAAVRMIEDKVHITIANSTLFGDPDKSHTVAEEAKGALEKIANIMKADSTLHITIHGNSNAVKFSNKLITDNWDLSALQAAAVARVFQTDFAIDPKRMDASAESEYNTEAVETVTRFVIASNFESFFYSIKEIMDNGSD